MQVPVAGNGKLWRWELPSLPMGHRPRCLGAVRWVTRSVAAGQSAGEGRLRKYVTGLQLQRGLRLGVGRAVRLLLLYGNWYFAVA